MKEQANGDIGRHSQAAATSASTSSQSVDWHHEGESRTVEDGPETAENKPTPEPTAAKRKVQRHSPDRLLRRKVVLPGNITVSAEKHNGRLVVRVESPDDKQ